MKTLLMAQWIAPMASPPMREAGVVFENDTILAAGLSKALRQAHPDACVVELGDAIILPGLINAHTHLELSDLAPPPVPGALVSWLSSMIARSASATPQTVEHATRIGVEQSLRFGITTVADISRHFAITRPVLAESKLNAVSFGEITAMGRRRGELEERLSAALAPTPGVRLGLEPHAPYSVELGGYRRCAQVAGERGLALTTHLAESPDEAQFLAELRGPFRELWDKLPRFDDLVQRFEGGPIRLARAAGLLDYPTLLAHVNYCDDDELEIIALGKASVIYCPRTHRYFGHPPHRWREMLGRGINVALGTDSCASSPDLNLLDDLRLVRKLAPEVPPQRLFELVTTNAGRALGDSSIGAIAPQGRADLIVFPVTTADPLEGILASGPMPIRVYSAGRAINS